MAIVDRGLWEAVQAILTKRSVSCAVSDGKGTTEILVAEEVVEVAA